MVIIVHAYDFLECVNVASRLRPRRISVDNVLEFIDGDDSDVDGFGNVSDSDDDEEWSMDLQVHITQS